MDATELKDFSRAKLITDVKAVVEDAEAYLAASVGQTGEAYAAARMKLERTLDETKTQIADTHRALTEKARTAARLTDGYVHERPWTSIAVGASAGLLLGLFLARR
jgi:ElaB/YqjD/DUF883 family membrane-anchored ribosome-binding protein